MNKTSSVITKWLPVILWMGLIFCASAMHSRPSTPGLSHFHWDDKLQHSGAYAILAALVWRALENNRPRWWLLCVSITIAVLYGASDEWHQSFVPGRECSISDLSADSLGAAIAALVLMKIRPRHGSATKNKQGGGKSNGR